MGNNPPMTSGLPPRMGLSFFFNQVFNLERVTNKISLTYRVQPEAVFTCWRFSTNGGSQQNSQIKRQPHAGKQNFVSLDLLDHNKLLWRGLTEKISTCYKNKDLIWVGQTSFSSKETAICCWIKSLKNC